MKKRKMGSFSCKDDVLKDLFGQLYTCIISFLLMNTALTLVIMFSDSLVLESVLTLACVVFWLMQISAIVNIVSVIRVKEFSPDDVVFHYRCFNNRRILLLLERNVKGFLGLVVAFAVLFVIALCFNNDFLAVVYVLSSLSFFIMMESTLVNVRRFKKKYRLGKKFKEM